MASPRSGFSKSSKQHRREQHHMGISTSAFLGTSSSLAASTLPFSPSTTSESNNDIGVSDEIRKGMGPRRPLGTEFPAGEQRYRSARLRCSLACERYNRQPEDNDAEQRSRLFLESLPLEPSSESTLSALNQSTSLLPNGTTATSSKTCEPAAASAKSSSLAAAVTASTRCSTPGFSSSKPIGSGISTGSLAGTDGKPPEAAASPGVSLLSPLLDKTTITAQDDLFALEASTRTTTLADAIPIDIPKSPSAKSLQSLISAKDGGVNGSTQTNSLPSTKSSPNGILRGKRFPGQGVAPYIKPPLYIDYGSRLEIGTSTFINRNCTILDNPIHSIRIGERCMIGPNFSIYAIGHPLDSRLREGPSGAPSFALGVNIGDDCWIGGNVTILGGVNIGKGCTIGANSLVTRDIPAHHLAFGVPARVIRRVSTPIPGSESDFDEDIDGYSFGRNWVMPEWIDSLTYRRVVRLGGHDFVAIEMIVAILVALVSGILIKMLIIS